MELPVVATDDFGIPEMVPVGAGLLVPRDDVPALAQAIRQVLSLTPAERALMGKIGREVVEARFREDEGAGRLAVWLSQVLT